MRRIIFMTLVAALIALTPAYRSASPHPAAAYQTDEEWFAYVVHVLGDSRPEALIRIDEHGDTQTYTWPIRVETGIFVSFSPNGQLLAYCEPSDEATQMVMWDIAAEQPLWSRNFGPTSVCGVFRWNFDPTGSLIAVGIGSDNDHAGDGPHWRIVVLDVTNGDIVSELNDQMESVIVLGLDVFGDVTLLPVVKRFAENQLIFTLDPSVIEGNRLQAYSWTVDSETIQLVDYWGNGSDFLPETGEMLIIETDGITVPGVPIPIGNSLSIVHADGVHTVFQQPNLAILSAFFVNDGQTILITVYEPESMTNQLVFISRDGEMQIRQVDEYIGFPIAAPGGFLITKHFYVADAPFAAQVEFHRGDDVRILWQLQNDPNTEEEMAFVIFSRPTPAAPDLPPFPEMPLP